ncbi:DUF350 domain-containing protein [Brevibacillus laterosporus]|uniref:DUF350 domain-containing protein n=1 Tax=Brevibacillus laterosporus TaxID=1465 RepID=UPI00036EC744|nr:DUF350 domain-containing protein [Brevibacillus laterosporus]ATO51320.1 DUF350 domain-containing protein [Brevibacillus laterosporus DSM 25]MBG9803107.1 surface protein [Brevibacillus laterosporus]MED2005319.1 DUF350 domain-containing protein [Brevibacillus laterosporus]MED4765012.1 DUF350 domain-containing protein [Brevibacillus laterosporus]TPH12308.1 DUF350 domain-containing protein [Brevibacillus laterosporus]
MSLVINFLLYAGTAFAMMLLGLVLFVVSTTKVKEFQLIANNNQAAAMTLGGKMLGLAFVLGSAVANSVSLVDMVIWSGVGIVAQIIFFFLAELITIRFSIREAIEKNNTAVGILLMMVSISIGWIIGQCLTY